MTAHPSTEVHPEPADAGGRLAAGGPSRDDVAAAMNAMECVDGYGPFGIQCTTHLRKWTDRGCPVAVSIAAAVVASCEGRHKAEALEAWIGEWPATPSDGTFLATVARDGLTRAAAYRASERTDDE